MMRGNQYPKMADTLGGATPEISENKNVWLVARSARKGTKWAI